MGEATTLDEATAIAERLRRGFSPARARHAAAMRLRHERGEFPELAGYANRLEFAIWLIDHGRLSDEIPELPAWAAAAAADAAERKAA